MKHYRPRGVLLDGATVVEAFQIYNTVSDRIADQWKPVECSIEKFTEDNFDELCTTSNVSAEDRKVYVRAFTGHRKL